MEISTLDQAFLSKEKNVAYIMCVKLTLRNPKTSEVLPRTSTCNWMSRSSACNGQKVLDKKHCLGHLLVAPASGHGRCSVSAPILTAARPLSACSST